MNKATCNQCLRHMKGKLVFDMDSGDKVVLTACIHPECPNFSLLQVPLEMVKLLSKSKQRG